MSCLGNIVWMVFGGFIAGLGYILGGLLVCLTIIGIPIGKQAIKLGVATMSPFGRRLRINKNDQARACQVFNTWQVFI